MSLYRDLLAGEKAYVREFGKAPTEVTLSPEEYEQLWLEMNGPPDPLEKVGRMKVRVRGGTPEHRVLLKPPKKRQATGPSHTSPAAGSTSGSTAPI